MKGILRKREWDWYIYYDKLTKVYPVEGEDHSFSYEPLPHSILFNPNQVSSDLVDGMEIEFYIEKIKVKESSGCTCMTFGFDYVCDNLIEGNDGTKHCTQVKEVEMNVGSLKDYLVDKIVLNKEELITFMNNVADGIGSWSDTSYRICEFIGIDPTQGT